MKDDTLLKLRKFEADIKTKNADAKKIVSALPAVAEDVRAEVEKAVEETQAVIAEIKGVEERVKGWRRFFVCWK